MYIKWQNLKIRFAKLKCKTKIFFLRIGIAIRWVNTYVIMKTMWPPSHHKNSTFVESTLTFY